MSHVGKSCVICGKLFAIHFIGHESNIFCPECIKRMGNLKDVLYPEKGREPITCGKCRFLEMMDPSRITHWCTEEQKFVSLTDFCSSGELKDEL